ncbi:uncharacterized protein LOC108674022 [Hyalella azteca]|uniref:Uncharacterized protein LOC108674022 n=1 Tax=Hyalella azteca TaxID=294128 RepID=A0A979FI83_HYAAZ|nr:uncharacterized protein LOC108674022 [Hyalella azteca]
MSLNESRQKTPVVDVTAEKKLSINEPVHLTIVIDEATEKYSSLNEVEKNAAIIDECTKERTSLNGAGQETTVVDDTLEENSPLNEPLNKTTVTDEATEKHTSINEAAKKAAVIDESPEERTSLNGAGQETTVIDESTREGTSLNGIAQEYTVIDEVTKEHASLNESAQEITVIDEVTKERASLNGTAQETTVIDETKTAQSSLSPEKPKYSVFDDEAVKLVVEEPTRKKLFYRRVIELQRSETSLAPSESGEKHSPEIRHVVVDVPPDGGYGWVIVAAVCFILVIIPSVNSCYGFVYAKVMQESNFTNTQLVGVATVAYALKHLLSPASSRLSEVWGSRAVTVAGLVMSSAALLIASFVYHNLTGLFLSYGVLGGVGSSMVYPQLTIVTQQYFTTKRVTALALAGVGMPLGNIVMPPLVHYLLDNFELREALWIWSGILLSTCFAALLFHPVQRHMKQQIRIIPEEAQNTFNYISWQRSRRRDSVQMAFIDEVELARSGSCASITSKSQIRKTRQRNSVSTSHQDELRNKFSSSTAPGKLTLSFSEPKFLKINMTHSFIENKDSGKEEEKLFKTENNVLGASHSFTETGHDGSEPETKIGNVKNEQATKNWKGFVEELDELIKSYKDVVSHKVFFIACFSSAVVRLYIFRAMFTALACLVAALAGNLTVLYTSCFLMGSGIGVQSSTSSVLLVEAIGMALLSRGLGLSLFFVGILGLIVMPLNGG